MRPTGFCELVFFKIPVGIACPDDSGSCLASDGDALYSSESFLNQILVLTELRGIILIGGLFSLAVTDGYESTNHRLARIDARRTGDGRYGQ
jgi:hypothetical protein